MRLMVRQRASDIVHFEGEALTECPGCDRPLYLSNLVPEFEYDDIDGENQAVE